MLEDRCCAFAWHKADEMNVTVIGRNFYKGDGLNKCRFTPCIQSDYGPNTCKNIDTTAGELSEATITVEATYLIKTRVSCLVPPLFFQNDLPKSTIS